MIDKPDGKLIAVDAGFGDDAGGALFTLAGEVTDVICNEDRSSIETLFVLIDRFYRSLQRTFSKRLSASFRELLAQFAGSTVGGVEVQRFCRRSISVSDRLRRSSQTGRSLPSY